MTLRVGLIGFTCASGLGYETRRMWRKLPFDRLLALAHPIQRTAGLEVVQAEARGRPVVSVDYRAKAAGEANAFLQHVDVLVTVERVFPAGFFARARCKSIRTVLLVNPELLADHLAADLAHADVLVARTAECERVLREMGHGDHVVQVPCPLDIDELERRPRAQVRRFIYSDGRGGVRERKGWPAVKAVLEQNPDLPLTVLSQRLHVGQVPVGTDLRAEMQAPRDLYAFGDVAVQPSRREGVGLSLLEAMASGMPVLTTDAAPMREIVIGALGAEARRWLLPATASAAPGNPLCPVYDVDPLELNARLCALLRADVSRESLLMADYVADTHGESAWRRLWDVITGRGS